jgi:ribosomal subunit interface protein
MNIRYLFGSSVFNDEEKKYLDDKTRKISKLLKNVEADGLRVEVEVEQDKRNFWRVETMVKTPHNSFRAEKNDSNLKKAIDMMEEALMKQIRRKKERTIDNIRRGK